MPYEHQNRGVYVTNGGTAVNHNSPQRISNFVGIAIKQKVVPWSQGYTNPLTIAASEDYYLLTKGTVEVATISGIAKGDALYITTAATANVSTSSASGIPFGRVVELPTKRGTPSGRMRVDLDAKVF